MSLAFKEIFSTCHFSSCHIFERSYKWLTTSIFAIKLEGYTFNIHADCRRVFSERLSKRTTKNEQATIVFIDSFQFMSSRLDRLVNNLPAEAFKYTSEVFQGDRLKLMTKKGVYPYDYMDWWTASKSLPRSSFRVERGVPQYPQWWPHLRWSLWARTNRLAGIESKAYGWTLDHQPMERCSFFTKQKDKV